MNERNIAILLAYDGSNYHGWQMQKNAVSVCGTIQKALSKITGQAVTLHGCGRTDAGVHAEYYVANFHTSSAIPVDKIPFALNSHLPSDIAVRNAAETDGGFHAVGSCIQKEYTYRIYPTRCRDPFFYNRVLFWPYELNTDKLKAAACHFVGTHDFNALASAGGSTKTTVRTVYYCEIEERPPLIQIRVCANGFLYNMMRSIAGTLLYCASGKLASDDIPRILSSGNRTLAGPTAPAAGLYMTGVRYPAGSAEFT
jgi:tRNA pseudouridine38-40 synthase